MLQCSSSSSNKWMDDLLLRTKLKETLVTCRMLTEIIAEVGLSLWLRCIRASDIKRCRRAEVW